MTIEVGMGLRNAVGLLDRPGSSVPQLLLANADGRGPAEPSDARLPSEFRSPPTPAAVRDSCRILVVDDDLGIRVALSTFLEDEGYLVDVASNGQQALACLERQRPTLVLLDMRMPVMDGWEFARVLQARRWDIPLVVMTAARDAQAWAEQVAATAYVSKPFDYDALLAILDQLCHEPRP